MTRRYPQFNKTPSNVKSLPSVGSSPQTVVRRKYPQLRSTPNNVETLDSLGVPAAGGGATHTTSGALTAQAATLAGIAAHATLHATSGALAAQSATIAGTAAHATVHATSGALQAESATISGEARDETNYVPPSNKGAGRSRRRRLHVVEIDGEDFIVGSEEEAVALLENAKEEAEQIARQAIERAAKVKVRPVRKVIADARKSLALPDIKAPGLEDYAAQITQHIEELYQDALRTIEIAALIAKREREDEDDEDILLLMA